MPKVKVQAAKVNDVRDGYALRIDAGARPLLLSRQGQRFFAIDAICSHAGGRLEDGAIQHGCVTCPIHGAVFDLATGKASPETAWASDLDTFPVTSEKDAIFVEIEERTAALNAEPANDGACPWLGA